MPATASLQSGRARRRLTVPPMAAALTLSLLPHSAPAQIVPPPGFEVIAISPALNEPVAMAFAPDGRLFVAEKAGIVKVIQNNAVVSTFIDLRNEVNGNQDRGMLGLALDPNFASNRRVYMFYAVDPVFGEPDEDASIATFSRLVRYEGTAASNGNLADPATRTVLIGGQPNQGVPQCWRSHSTGALRFGADGSLLAAHGESAIFGPVDAGGGTPLCFQPPLFESAQDIGAFRAQMLDSMDGKILRVDPQTGNGLPTNPYWNGDPMAPRSRVWVSGLRNPYRYCVRPGTGSANHPGALYIGDVGWNNWEELSVAPTGGENMGWPCREGPTITTGYPDVDFKQWDCASIGTPGNPGPLTGPIIAFHHFQDNHPLSTPPGISGFVSTAGVFHAGNNYPSPFRGGLFFADYVIGWIKVARVNAAHELVTVFHFGNGGDGPVDFAVDPVTGDVCYLSLNNGVVYRLHSLIGPGDVNHDGVVNVTDLVAIVLAWGPCANLANCAADLNANGVVDVGDLIEVILNWG